MPTSEIIDTLETIQGRADAIQMSAECLNDDLSDLLSELREKAKPAKVNHVFVPGDVLRASRDYGLKGDFLVLFDDHTGCANLLIYRGDGEGHPQEGFKDSWWIDPDGCEFIGHLNIDLERFKEEPKAASEPHKFIPGDVVNLEDGRRSCARCAVLWVDPHSGRILVHRGDGMGHSGWFHLPGGFASKDGWFCDADQLTFIYHSDDDLSDYFVDGKIPGAKGEEKPAEEDHEFIPGDVVSVLRDGLSVDGYSTLSGAHIVLGEDDADNTLLVHRGDGKGHGGRGSKDGWWVKKKDVQFLAHLNMSLSPFFGYGRAPSAGTAPSELED